MRNILFTPTAWGEYTYWQSQDKKTLKRINTLIEAAAHEPFTGIGKPEALQGDLTGFYSRRIDDTNRIIYKADDNALQIVACRYYYKDK